MCALGLVVGPSSPRAHICCWHAGTTSAYMCALGLLGTTTVVPGWLIRIYCWHAGTTSAYMCALGLLGTTTSSACLPDGRHARAAARRRSAHFTCFTSTKVQILTPVARAGLPDGRHARAAARRRPAVKYRGRGRGRGQLGRACPESLGARDGQGGTGARFRKSAR
jgi:hypothetical protein